MNIRCIKGIWKQSKCGSKIKILKQVECPGGRALHKNLLLSPEPVQCRYLQWKPHVCRELSQKVQCLKLLLTCSPETSARLSTIFNASMRGKQRQESFSFKKDLVQSIPVITVVLLEIFGVSANPQNKVSAVDQFNVPLACPGLSRKGMLVNTVIEIRTYPLRKRQGTLIHLTCCRKLQLALNNHCLRYRPLPGWMNLS